MPYGGKASEACGTWASRESYKKKKKCWKQNLWNEGDVQWWTMRDQQIIYQVVGKCHCILWRVLLNTQRKLLNTWWKF